MKEQKDASPWVVKNQFRKEGQNSAEVLLHNIHDPDTGNFHPLSLKIFFIYFDSQDHVCPAERHTI